MSDKKQERDKQYSYAALSGLVLDSARGRRCVLLSQCVV
jgi:hypothetical protein